MISIERARGLVLANLPAPRIEQVNLRDAFGRVLATRVHATHDVPPFRRALMDGYAVRSADVAGAPVRLFRAGEIRAGAGLPPPLRPGFAMAIYTGAPVPEGADAVQMVEQTRRVPETPDCIEIGQPVAAGGNIAPIGHEAARGATVLEAGSVIGPTEAALLAMFGRSTVPVWARPEVALAATGDELVGADQTPGPGQIRNSNSYSLTAQFAFLGIMPRDLGIARDDAAALGAVIEEGLRSDVFVLTGGVSMGEYDLVKGALETQGARIHFDKVAMKPGKPTVFATRGSTLVFGLPGNPVSAFIAFENFVRPAIGRLCGLRAPELPRIRGRLTRSVRQVPGRTAFVPAWVSCIPEGWAVEPLAWKGSADVIGFSRANAALVFPGERDSMAEGEIAEAMLMPDFFLRQRGEEQP